MAQEPLQDYGYNAHYLTSTQPSYPSLPPSSAPYAQSEHTNTTPRALEPYTTSALQDQAPYTRGYQQPNSPYGPPHSYHMSPEYQHSAPQQQYPNPQQLPSVSTFMNADGYANGNGNALQSFDTTGQVQPVGMRPRLTTSLSEEEGSVCFQVDVNGICVARREGLSFPPFPALVCLFQAFGTRGGIWISLEMGFQVLYKMGGSPMRYRHIFWNGQLTIIYELDNHMINGTKLLNVVGMTRGRRDGILKAEKQKQVVKIGPMHLKGVWYALQSVRPLSSESQSLTARLRIPYERALALANQEKITEKLYPLFVHNIGALLFHPSNSARALPQSPIRTYQQPPGPHEQGLSSEG